MCFTLTSTQYYLLDVSVPKAITSLQNIQIVFSQIPHLSHTNKLFRHRMFLHSVFSAQFQLLCVAVDLHSSDKRMHQFNLLPAELFFLILAHSVYKM